MARTFKSGHNWQIEESESGAIWTISFYGVGFTRYSRWIDKTFRCTTQYGSTAVLDLLERARQKPRGRDGTVIAVDAVRALYLAREGILTRDHLINAIEGAYSITCTSVEFGQKPYTLLIMGECRLGLYDDEFMPIA